MEESKTLPAGAVWEEFLLRNDVPSDWMQEVRSYERNVLSKRGS
jgi:L-rhamnose isomerase